MTTAYGATLNASTYLSQHASCSGTFRIFVNYSVSSTDTQTKLTVTNMGVQVLSRIKGTSDEDWHSAGWLTAESRLLVNNSNQHNVTKDYWWPYKTDSNSQPYVDPQNLNVITVNKTFTYNRGKSAQSIPVSANFYVLSELNLYPDFIDFKASDGKNAVCTFNLSVPAKPSYSVTYNLNGGSGNFPNQTKWYGENLTISSSIPTRLGYEFLGWSTSVDGSVSYQPGQTYTDNKSLALYAVWKLLFSVSFQNLSVARIQEKTEEVSNPVEDDFSEYVRVTGQYVMTGSESFYGRASVTIDGVTYTDHISQSVTPRNPDGVADGEAFHTGGDITTVNFTWYSQDAGVTYELDSQHSVSSKAEIFEESLEEDWTTCSVMDYNDPDDLPKSVSYSQGSVSSVLTLPLNQGRKPSSIFPGMSFTTEKTPMSANMSYSMLEGVFAEENNAELICTFPTSLKKVEVPNYELTFHWVSGDGTDMAMPRRLYTGNSYHPSLYPDEIEYETFDGTTSGMRYPFLSSSDSGASKTTDLSEILADDIDFSSVQLSVDEESWTPQETGVGWNIAGVDVSLSNDGRYITITTTYPEDPVAGVFYERLSLQYPSKEGGVLATASRTAVLTKAEFILDFHRSGKGMGIGTPSPEDGLDIGWKAKFLDIVEHVKDAVFDAAVTVKGILNLGNNSVIRRIGHSDSWVGGHSHGSVVQTTTAPNDGSYSGMLSMKTAGGNWGVGVLREQITFSFVQNDALESNTNTSYALYLERPLKGSYNISGLRRAGTGNYWGVIDPNGADNEYIRTTTAGIIPFNTSGGSTLGTSSWRFGAVHANHYYNDFGVDLDEVNILWQGNMYMTANHTATLSKARSAQPNGIVMIFRVYNSGNPYGKVSCFVPKNMNDTVYCFCCTEAFGSIGTKCVGVWDTSITGVANNNNSGTKNGITYNNAAWVLSYVIGV